MGSVNATMTGGQPSDDCEESETELLFTNHRPIRPPQRQASIFRAAPPGPAARQAFHNSFEQFHRRLSRLQISLPQKPRSVPFFSEQIVMDDEMQPRKTLNDVLTLTAVTAKIMVR